MKACNQQRGSLWIVDLKAAYRGKSLASASAANPKSGTGQLVNLKTALACFRARTACGCLQYFFAAKQRVDKQSGNTRRTELQQY